MMSKRDTTAETDRSKPLLLPRRARVAVAVALALAIAAAAALSSAAGRAAGPAPAKGKPVVLAMINQETGFAAFPQTRQVAQAFVKYVNTKLGGWHGRPFKLVTCSTAGTPPSSSACATRLLDSHPVAVAEGVDLGSGASVPVFAKARLAVIGGLPLSAADSTSANSIQFSGGIAAAYSAFVNYAVKALHAKKVSIVYTDEPAGQFALNVVMQPALKALGVTDVKTVAQNPAAPDWSASIAAAAGNSPDVIITTTPPLACVSVMKSHKELGSSAKLYVTGACGAPGLLAAAGDAADGVLSVDDLQLPSSTSDKDVKLFLSVLKSAGLTSVPLDEPAQVGANEIMNIWRVFNTIPAGKLTTASILKAFRTGRSQPNFMAHPFTCDGKQLAGSPAVCNAFVHVTTYKGGRQVLADQQWWRGP
jgi:branched-chain amino acid transport system substrate-binding protein